MPYLTPNSAPETTVCRTLVIPDDTFWLSIVNGALSELIYAHRFEQFGTATPDETAARFAQMYDEFVVSECAVPPNPFIVGEVRLFAFSAVPDEWLRCEGQSLLRADYADLFAAIGTGYGSVDGTHFNLPDMRGKFVAGYWSNSPVSGAYIIGATGGEEFHALTEAENAPHTHTGVVSPNNPLANRALVSTGGIQTVRPAGTSDSSGSGTAHENRPPFVVAAYAIYTGV